MSGTFGIFESELPNINVNYLLNTINPLNLCNTNIINIDNIGLIGVSSLKDTPLKGERFFEDNIWIVVFTGDLIDYKIVPYEKIITILKHKKFDHFKEFSGIFSIVAYNKKTKKLFIISDLLSVNPIYYLIKQGEQDGLYFSTKMSTFCRLPKNLSFNEKWLWDYLFFNYPIDETTFLKGVKRMPASSILETSLDLKGQYSLFRYTTGFQKKTPLKKGKVTLDLALQLFSERIPKYYEGVDNKACSLTAGWDARTVLAFCPDMDKILSYTYGLNGCRDLENAAYTANYIGINHKKITFKKEFLESLPDYMLNTVYLSSGMQGILRSHLLYIYEQLCGYSQNFPLILSGIYFDNIYRGHMNSPSQISNEMMEIMINDKQLEFNDFNFMLKNDFYDSFVTSVSKKLKDIRNEHGSFNLPEFHLSYQLYEVLRNYFGAEISIANEFTTIRLPALDEKLIDFAYSSIYSALNFSEFGGHKRGDKENILQAYLISKKHKSLSNVPINDLILPKLILKGNFYFLTYCKYKKILAKTLYFLTKKKKSDYPPLEDWNYWLNDVHREFIDNLIFSEDSIIQNYFKSEYLEKLKNERNIHWIGKLGTIEINLRLIKNNWERFW